MQITATTPISPLDRQSALAQQNGSLQQFGQARDMAAEQAKKDAEKAKVFTPAPPLRPTIQDYVDINRTLIALRKL